MTLCAVCELPISPEESFWQAMEGRHQHMHSDQCIRLLRDELAEAVRLQEKYHGALQCANTSASRRGERIKELEAETQMTPISPISPKSIIQATLTQLLRQHPALSLAQILIWVEEAFTQWHDRNLGPETYDPQEGLDLDAHPPEPVFHQDCPGTPEPKKNRPGDCPPAGF